MPAEARIHPVFRISQLKAFTPNYSPVFSELPCPPDLTTMDAQPAAILKRRLKKKCDLPVVQLLVQWENQPTEATTWEDYDVLRACYLPVPIWEEASSQGAPIVTPTVSSLLCSVSSV